MNSAQSNEESRTISQLEWSKVNFASLPAPGESLTWWDQIFFLIKVCLKSYTQKIGVSIHAQQLA